MVDREIPTLTVLGSQAVARADGRAAIVLTTQERGPIAFELNLQTIPLLRAGLDRIETILRRSPGNT